MNHRIVNRAALAAVGLGVLMAGPPPGAGDQLPGLMGMTTASDLYVVYPTGPAEQSSFARISAERRASFLETVFEVSATAVADAALTSEQAAGKDLLVLGWNNAVLRDERLASLVRTFEPRRVAFDLLSVRPGEDLAFAAVSPFDADHRFFFWSRIDLELDRFHVLPLTGSDWAIYHDYTITQQGMFEDRHAWPPIPSPDGSMDMRALKLPLPQRSASTHYILHGRPADIDAEQAQAILQRREAALARVADRLDGIPDGFRISVHVYPDDDRKRELTDVPDPSHIVPYRYEMHMVQRFATSSNPHDDGRLLARARFGPCYLTPICEGLAVYLEQPGDDSELLLLGAAMLDRGTLPPLDLLLDEEAFRQLGSSGVSYPAAGLLFAWLAAEDGLEGISRVYGLREGDARGLAAALGRPDSFDPDASWRSWLRARRAAQADELEFRKLAAQARKLQDEGDPDGAMDALRQALRVKPGDALTRYKLGLAAANAGELASARSAFAELADGAWAPADARYRVFAMYQLGRLSEREDRSAEALEWYGRMLDEPDLHDSHRMAIDAIEAVEGETRVPVDP